MDLPPPDEFQTDWLVKLTVSLYDGKIICRRKRAGFIVVTTHDNWDHAWNTALIAVTAVAPSAG